MLISHMYTACTPHVQNIYMTFTPHVHAGWPRIFYTNTLNRTIHTHQKNCTKLYILEKKIITVQYRAGEQGGAGCFGSLQPKHSASGCGGH